MISASGPPSEATACATPVLLVALGRVLIEVDEEAWYPVAGDPSTLDDTDRVVHTLELQRHRLLSIAARGVCKVQGVASTLDSLSSAASLVLVADESRAVVDAILGLASLRDHFRFVVSADDVERIRPSPDLHQHALRRLGVGPSLSRVIAIEGSVDGEVAARAAGIANVIVSGGRGAIGCGAPRVRSIADLSAGALCGHLAYGTSAIRLTS
jgi:beta-phosphoglucomutase-like phosphatase (HAD superfamily)